MKIYASAIWLSKTRVFEIDGRPEHIAPEDFNAALRGFPE